MRVGSAVGDGDGRELLGEWGGGGLVVNSFQHFNWLSQWLHLPCFSATCRLSVSTQVRLEKK